MNNCRHIALACGLLFPVACGPGDRGSNVADGGSLMNGESIADGAGDGRGPPGVGLDGASAGDQESNGHTLDAATVDGGAAGDAGPLCSPSSVLSQYPQGAVACIEGDCTSQLEACGSTSCGQCMPALSVCAMEICLVGSDGGSSDDASPDDDAGCSACQSAAQCCTQLGQIYGSSLELECTGLSSDCANEATCEVLLSVYGASCE
jgi:hypothetical protein